MAKNVGLSCRKQIQIENVLTLRYSCSKMKSLNYQGCQKRATTWSPGAFHVCVALLVIVSNHRIV